MNKRMYKYNLPIDGEPHMLELVPGTKFRHGDLAFGARPYISLWAEVPDVQDVELNERTFVVIPTGFESVPQEYEFVATVVDYGRELVWHVFEVK